MRKFYQLSTLVLTLLLIVSTAPAQDFSNKGKDFYLCFPAHVQSSNLATLSIWITSDQASSGMVTMGNGAFSQAFNVTANGLTEVRIPHSAAHISNGESNMVIRKSIRVKTDPNKPAVVAYAQQWAGARSAATLLLPVSVLGKQYYSVNFTQSGSDGRSQFNIIAVKDNTVVGITPRFNGVVQPTITINLPQAGDMYQYQASNTGADLTGTFIESIASGSGSCVPIAVFSGSSNIRFGIEGCGSASSADPLFQQLYPITSWGKNFGFIPFANYASGTPYRIMASQNNTAVFINGSQVATLNRGEIYPPQFSNQPPVFTSATNISADKPICVAQYAQSNACNGQGGGAQGDPDMVLLNPIEQNISDITIFSTRQEVINTQWLNVVIKTEHAPSFKISRNGGAFAVPTSAWQTFASMPGYSYLRELLPAPGPISPFPNVSDSYRLMADGGFNAIAYGWGTNESYAYSAGTNIKDLYQQVGTATEYGGASSPTLCINSSTKFKISLPYRPDSILWDFQGAQANYTLRNPPPHTGPLVEDSITVVNGVNIYWYSIPTPYTFSTAGVFPALITTYSQNVEGCGSEQEIPIEITVYNLPLADFSFATDGCVTNPVSFTENNTSARPIISRYWSFGDAGSATINNPSHTYTTAGTYNVKYSFINDIGCKADTATKPITLSNPPQANFSSAAPYCVGSPVSFTNLSDPIPGGTYLWDFGDATTSTDENPTHIYTTPGTKTVTLTISSVSGCTSFPFSATITINEKPTADFNLPGVCLPNGNAQFNDGSLPGTGNTLTAWAWDFGDLATSTLQNPLHIYTGPAPFNVSLTVTNDKGCMDTKTQLLTTVYQEPEAAFTTQANVCLGAVSTFTDNSTAQNNTVTAWAWDFGDGNTSTLKNPVHTYAAAGTYTVTLNVTTAAGCPTVTKFATQQVNVLALPTATIAGNASVCVNGTSPQVTFTGAGGSAPYTFTYTIDNGSGPVTQPTITTTSGNSISIPVPTAAAGTYRYAITNVKEGSSAGCAQSQNGFAEVLVRPLPLATISSDLSVCLNGTSPDITFTGSNGTAPYTFSYKINNGPTQTISTSAGNSTTVSVPTNAVGTFTYEIVGVSESSADGCVNNLTGISATVNVKSLPTANMVGSAEVCLNAPAHTILLNGSGGTAPYKFRYSISGDPTPFYEVTSDASGTGQILVPTGVAGTFVYQLISVTEGSSSACSQAQAGSVTVTVMPLPTADFNVALPTCDRDAITFTNTSLANAGAIVRWKWRFADSEPQVVMTSGSPFTHVFPGPGTYNVSLEVETDKGCLSNQRTTPVVVEVRPSAAFTTPVACINDVAAQFFDNGNVSAGNVTAWEWDFGDPNANAGNPNTSNLKNPTHHFTVAGPYTVRQIVISDKGCRDTLDKTFIVNGMPVSNFTVEHSGSVCSNQQIKITDAASSTFGDIIRTEIFWDYLNDPTAKTDDAAPVPGKQYTHTYAEFGTPATKTFRIRYVAYTGENCISSFERDVTLMATPTLVFDPVPGVCADVPAFQVTQAQLTNALPGPPGVFTGNGISPTGMFDPAAATPGSHLIRFTFTGSNGCTNFVERTIDVYPVPVVNAGPDKVVLEGGQVMLSPAQNVGVPITYAWTPPAGLSDPAIAFPLASPADDITYTLTVTTEFGCKASDEVFVKVLKKPLIPNIFSPNGDGIHDRWELPYLESYPGCTIELFNRYGQMVFRTVGYATPWDGKVNGKDVPVGTYYYVIDPKNGRPRLSGYVDIIR